MDTAGLNSPVQQLDPADTYRTHHPLTSELLSSTENTFSKTDHIPGPLTNLNRLLKIEMIQTVFTDHNGIKADISNTGKSPNIWKHNNAHQDNTLFKEY